MARHRTQLLLLLIALAGGLSLVAYWRLDKSRSAADSSRRDFGIVHQALADLAGAPRSRLTQCCSATVSPATPETYLGFGKNGASPVDSPPGGK